MEKQGNLHDNKKEGVWNFYYYSFPNQKQLQRKIIPYKNDLINGKLISFHPNGQKRSLISFRNGKRSGKYESYYNNGVKKGSN